MWIVEVNFAGRRFTYQVHGPRRRHFHFSPRNLSWRTPQLPDPRVA
jgi:hypothetical protein